MSRYLRKLRALPSLGPTEERGFALWVGYDIVGTDDDLTYAGLERVDDWTDEALAARGVKSFTRVEPDDEETYRKLGITRRR